MSWWMIAIAIFIVVRISHRRRSERWMWRGGYGRFPGRAPWSVDYSARGSAESPPLPPPAPNPRLDLERTIAAVRDSYVAGRITVEEYERRLDELYQTAEGKRLRGA